MCKVNGSLQVLPLIMLRPDGGLTMFGQVPADADDASWSAEDARTRAGG